jgi:hypothetical protein
MTPREALTRKLARADLAEGVCRLLGWGEDDKAAWARAGTIADGLLAAALHVQAQGARFDQVAAPSTGCEEPIVLMVSRLTGCPWEDIAAHGVGAPVWRSMAELRGVDVGPVWTALGLDGPGR